MKELPKIVAQTEVGKTVEVKVWRNKKEISKKIKLGRLETSDDFKVKKKEKQKDEIIEIKSLKIKVRLLTAKDIKIRKLPNQTTGLIVTEIQKDSPMSSLAINDIIVEVQKKKIKSATDLERIVSNALKSTEKTILVATYNNQNRRRLIGVKLD